MTIRLIYKSRATFPPFSVTDVDIMREADSHNSENDITGFLVRLDWMYIQVLEGEREAVNTLIQGIIKDPRHYAYQMIQLVEIEQRMFGDWSMGYMDMSGKKLAFSSMLQGLSDTSPAEDMGHVLNHIAHAAQMQSGQP
ncbi:BLUF domain-containing protein [Phaeobacter sp. C3_T13_0]|uniref:BLUF domain-containing protein n=1 Tax=Phaeobacter cretensis TaxID=3342641 RepID=UPI0039BCA764